ncbi:trypsin-like peptidase domain-containing protein [Candidatus Bathyarchaeota archaeon]|nr:trypsin-like peptidase domain-containing protein [Candidatus Bathyarchaeota archaeon]
MSDEWFYGSRNRSTGGDNRLWAVVIIFMVLNMGVVSYFTFFRGSGSSDISTLNTELDNLRFQLSSAQAEINSLKEEVRIGQHQTSDTDSLILTQLYNRTRNSVVLITVRTATGGGTGSGFILDKEGRIITNNHVVEDATRIDVTFLDGTIVEAELVGRDPYSDMAIIQVDRPAGSLEPVRLGTSSELLVGETVVAIGNPFGLANTMTLGIVSAVGRQASAPGNYVIVDVIQTDAAINPGNSGGPLLNLRGEVVGVNTWILSDTGQFSGIGFAVPSDTLKREIDSIIDTGSYQHPWIGIEGREMRPDIAEAMGLDGDTKGTLVINVTPGGPADTAGVLGGDEQATIDGTLITIGGDVIIGADGKAMNSFYDLIFYVSRYKQPGDALNLNIIRDGAVTDAELTLGVRPSP